VQYTIKHDHIHYELITMVSLMIKSGWKPIGGVSTTDRGFFQALIREDAPAKEEGPPLVLAYVVNSTGEVIGPFGGSWDMFAAMISTGLTMDDVDILHKDFAKEYWQAGLQQYLTATEERKDC